jgi:protocatechuate 3,4-dioxygenase beta subunit
MPKDLESESSIVTIEEKGEKMMLHGTIYKLDGSPATSIIVYAYQTNDQGIYPEGPNAHGKLRGWAMTDDHGKYSFITIRPKAYPNRDVPQHIHLHIIEPEKGTYYIDSAEFSDDPLLTERQREKRQCRGGCGIVKPQKDKSGTWYARRDIYLGRAILGY